MILDFRISILDRASYLAVRSVRQSIREKKRWRSDPKFRWTKQLQARDWKRAHDAEGKRIRAEIRAAQGRRVIARRILPEVHDLPWNIDDLQEAALAELEGRDPKAAVMEYHKRENRYLYTTVPYPTLGKKGKEISL